MLMFLENKVHPDDPRMERVYRHFADNLDHILDAAESAGAGVVVSTVAVNLRDSAPFASLHKPGLSPQQLDQWQAAYDAGTAAQAKGEHEAALAEFETAAKIDDSYADLTFATARSLAAVGRGDEAAEQFALARDQDALRFRCDSKLNEAIRASAKGREGERVRLVDAERVFAENSADGIPGKGQFYEHVHLTFAGNYLLARSIADEIVPLLSENVRSSAKGEWLTADELGKQLAWTAWGPGVAAHVIMGRVAGAAF
jgi:hypothetical protein